MNNKFLYGNVNLKLGSENIQQFVFVMNFSDINVLSHNFCLCGIWVIYFWQQQNEVHFEIIGGKLLYSR
jgi:hypothetical protein